MSVSLNISSPFIEENDAPFLSKQEVIKQDEIEATNRARWNTLSSRLSMSLFPKEKNICVHEWEIGALWKNRELVHSKKKIILLQLDQELKYVTYDLQTAKGSYGSIPNQETMSLEETITFLSKCEIDDLEDDAPSFSPPALQRAFDNIDVTLLCFKNDLIWQLFNRKDQSNYRLPVSTSTYLNWDECINHTRKLHQKLIIDNNPDITNEERISFLKSFNITKIEKTDYEYLPYIIHILPMNQKSNIDERVRVSKFSWAVTLIADGQGPEGNHAVIVVEGLKNSKRPNDGHYFMYKAQFTGRTIESYDINPSAFKYDERTEIWNVSSRKVKKMFEAINFEKKPENRPKFFITGKDSVFIFNKETESHNCFTWARDKLKMLKIDLGESAMGLVVTRTKNFTQKSDFYKNISVKSLI